MNENNEILLSVKDLYVEYTSDKKIIHAVNGVSLDIPRERLWDLSVRPVPEKQQ